MKILCTSLWENSWLPYWTKYLNERGHEVQWLIGSGTSYKSIKPYTEWSDAILCMWAGKWAEILTHNVCDKPIYIIHQSFEVFEKNIDKIKWDNVKQLFMVNESHFKLFNKRVKNVPAIFIKNGIDTDFWGLIKRDNNARHRIAWIANINEKKGAMLVPQAMSQIHKRDRLVTLKHLGKMQSTRIEQYFNTIMAHSRTLWFDYGWVDSPIDVRKFIEDTGNLLSCSLVEGHPVNIIEAMSTGMKPLIHRYPGVEQQFPAKWVWDNFDDLIKIYEEEPCSEEYRQYIVDNYYYKDCYKPVVDYMEGV